MDPDATLKEILNAIKEFEAGSNEDDTLMAAYGVINAFEDLDKWLSKGGFLPERWKR